MWVVAKINHLETQTFKSQLKKHLGFDIQFYNPLICIKKVRKQKSINQSRPILNSYIFCYHQKFSDENTINQTSNIKGLNYFLKSYKFNQEEILSFINNCKSFEDKEGFISPSFFKDLLSNKAKFISGPFTNLFFDIIEKQKGKMKIMLGNFAIAISDKSKYLYQPV
jgi:hypothetical protein